MSEDVLGSVSKKLPTSSTAKPTVSLQSICEAIRAFPFPQADLVLGIATGGIYPAMLIAHELGLPFRSVQVNYRDETNTPQRPQPAFLSDLRLDGLSPGAAVLLVDDVSVTGKTLGVVKAALSGFRVTTIVLKGKADHVLLPTLNTCVTWPWYEYKTSQLNEG
ncbi:phosphoribosyltransferase [Lunatimonas lonarensis]|uniref:phosphoribosyltransferase n=1 Tax=Lunatimonas lonarensis TaxID=1232681 RepID=UPI00055F4D10|nr:phosphoribosyltransferase [Lunatimonas lonarensis]